MWHKSAGEYVDLLKASWRPGPGRWSTPQVVERTRGDIDTERLAIRSGIAAVALWQVSRARTTTMRAAVAGRRGV